MARSTVLQLALASNSVLGAFKVHNDPKAYTEAFERTALQVRLECTYWASQLGALKISKGQAAYRALP